MKTRFNKEHNHLYNPLIGLSPIITVSMVEPFFGLTIALHIGVLLSVVVLMYNYFLKVYSNQPIVLFYLFFFSFYKFITSYVFIVPDGSILELIIFHGLAVVGIIGTFFMRSSMYKFFHQSYAGKAKVLENNLREFYFISKLLMVIMLLHVFLYVLSIYMPQLDVIGVHKSFDIFEFSLIVGLVVFEIFRIRYVSRLLDLEDFWPIVNKDGVVVGKVARSVALANSSYKELHPVVRIHFLLKDAVLLFRNEDVDSDGKWDCMVTTHLLYSEKIDDSIKRAIADRFHNLAVTPHFLLKHIVECQLENQYVLLYYVSEMEDAHLKHTNSGQLKYWPKWQVEENLGKGIFTEAFETEYEYLKNTVFVAEQFAAGIEK